MSALDTLIRMGILAPRLYANALGPNAENPRLPPAPRDVTQGPAVPVGGEDEGWTPELARDTAARYAATTRARSPVVTPGQATSPATASTPNTQAADSAIAPATEQAVESAQSQDSQQSDDPRSRLAQFGFAMAASRNPSLFGQIGEAGLAMMQGDRQQRQDDLRTREVAANEQYRQAQLALAQAEREWQRDPNNPLNIARLAQARSAVMRTSRSGGGGAGRITGQIIGEDGNLYGTTRDGQVVPYRTPDGNPFRRQTSDNAIESRRLRAMQTAIQVVRGTAIGMNLPDEEVMERATRLVPSIMARLSPATGGTEQPATGGTGAAPSAVRRFNPATGRIE